MVYTEQRTKVPRDIAQQIRGVAIQIRMSGVTLSMEPPYRHHDLLHRVADLVGRPLSHSEHEQGFLSATGKFLTRGHAARLCGRDGEQLYSEDLW